MSVASQSQPLPLSLSQQAELELERRKRKRRRHLQSLTLPDFIHELSPELDPPNHLAPLPATLQRACNGEPIRCVISTPPQHGKSLTVEHCIVRDLLRDPSAYWAYITYSAHMADQQGQHIRDLAERAGVQISPSTRGKAYWRTPQGGGLLATGIGGPITGQRALKRIVVDDAIKGHEDSESLSIRDNIFEWFQGSVVTRAHPDTAIVVVGTRWHHDDPIGRLMQQEYQGLPLWEVINLPAILDNGQALWPEKRPIEFLERQRAGTTPYIWEALMMGRPVPRGGAVFEGTVEYTALPTELAISIGVDFAVTAKTSSDYSAFVVLGQANDGRVYVLDALHRQCGPVEFSEHLKVLRDRHRLAQMHWDASTTERGTAEVFRKLLGFPILDALAHGDAFTRAIPVSSAWKQKQILVPAESLGMAWKREFMAEIGSFTGKNDPNDDLVAAFGSAYNGLRIAVPQTAVHGPIKTKFTASVSSAVAGKGWAAW